MTRLFKVYPQAALTGSLWRYQASIFEPATGITEHFDRTILAGVTAAVPLLVLKFVFDIEVADTDDATDIDDALFVDDIAPGPQTETVWEAWQTLAESIITSLDPEYTLNDYWLTWTKPNTAKIRNDARRALVTQRGWSILKVHQHEGDGSVTNG